MLYIRIFSIFAFGFGFRQTASGMMNGFIKQYYTMEILLHYIWKHRMYPLHELLTADGETVEIIDPGLHNSNAGPDFFNAKIKIGGMLWVGNVEIHGKASDGFCTDTTRMRPTTT